ncbi:MAG: transcriptional regulator [Phycisphaerales bacterium]|jgi:transcriptional regulator|nr:transcriptional regulator [Phycisphaerales bacterium]
MYVPSAFAEERLDVLHEFVSTHDFATLITNAGGEMVASHLPMLLLPTRGRYGTLQVHLARQNEQWHALEAGEPALVIFQGPHAYVSPRWYRNPISVPTWNYVVVHAHGTPRAMDDAALRDHLIALVSKYEPRDGGWDVGALPGDVMDKLQGQVVGFEIEIARLQGKWKLGQNRTVEDRQGAIAGLRQDGADTGAIALAEWMAAALRG